MFNDTYYETLLLITKNDRILKYVLRYQKLCSYLDILETRELMANNMESKFVLFH